MSRYQFYQDPRGEGYKTRSGVLNGINAHRRAAATDQVAEVKA